MPWLDNIALHVFDIDLIVKSDDIFGCFAIGNLHLQEHILDVFLVPTQLRVLVDDGIEGDVMDRCCLRYSIDGAHYELVKMSVDKESCFARESFFHDFPHLLFVVILYSQELAHL